MHMNNYLGHLLYVFTIYNRDIEVNNRERKRERESSVHVPGCNKGPLSLLLVGWAS